jgi:hypothetical protein
MKIRLTLTALLLSSACASAAEPPWERAWQACAVNLEHQCTSIGGANCNGWWPSVARCAIYATWGHNDPALTRQVNHCIDWEQAKRVRERSANNHGNPIREVIRCSTGQ